MKHAWMYFDIVQAFVFWKWIILMAKTLWKIVNMHFERVMLWRSCGRNVKWKHFQPLWTDTFNDHSFFVTQILNACTSFVKLIRTTYNAHYEHPCSLKKKTKSQIIFSSGQTLFQERISKITMYTSKQNSAYLFFQHVNNFPTTTF